MLKRWPFPDDCAYAAADPVRQAVGTLLLLWPTLTALWIAAEGAPGALLRRSSASRAVHALGRLRGERRVRSDFDGHVERTAIEWWPAAW